ncbi:HEAT repeat domain-containing protein [Niabella drilacis]|uniref:HEAT repeat-containing protein n=1 Tax=Niabella drilacis (strain DSM 25811 / CCM 8410 / CCUG 62505 / LMG 26954 / E90) TaxID=1285928 RepID=A0A1G6SE09_NIADE|nr:HEAT repeat domain-containing protein [Niabella drilacis]SDD14894.1 HEAT repeat-containing protein [Niabella drilacis]
MAFYDLSKAEREQLVVKIGAQLEKAVITGNSKTCLRHFNDPDTYIRKTAYLAVGRLYIAKPELQAAVLKTLEQLLPHNSFYVRQTVVNAAGEIGKNDFKAVQSFFDNGLFDAHHAVRNAVIGSVKKMGEVNPAPVLQWAKSYLHHEDKEIRREICHGIELRGRKYPQDILPLLKELEFDQTARVRNTLVHVLGQIAYKKGCLAIVLAHLKTWKNTALVADALEEIIDVHDRYKDFAVLTQDEARAMVAAYFKL